MSSAWEAEYDRRMAAGAPRRMTDLGRYQVQDDRGNWFHRAPGNRDCPCGRDERTGRRCDPYVSAPVESFEMIGGHYVPFWRLAEHLAELEAAAAEPEPDEPAAPRECCHNPRACGSTTCDEYVPEACRVHGIRRCTICITLPALGEPGPHRETRRRAS